MLSPKPSSSINKRKRSSSDDATLHSQPRKFFKKHRHGPQQKDAIPNGLSSIKKKQRDTKRLLRRSDLPADIRLENERRLKALQLHLEDKMIDETEKKMASKYHMVKFFERKKVTRKLKQAHKALANAKDESQRQQSQNIIDELNVDLNYILHFPNTEKYISLFPLPDATTKETIIRREFIREKIRAAMDSGEIESGAVENVFRETKKKLVRQRKLNKDNELKRRTANNPLYIGNKNDIAKAKSTEDLFFVNEDEEEDYDD